jgi:N-acetylmuramoyl-L-alanine amidase
VSSWARAAAVLLLAAPGRALGAEGPPRLAPRIKRIVVHVLGGPAYDRPERRFRFFDPPETQSRWKARFGAHWIVWTDGSLWPRHPAPGGPPSWMPDTSNAADEADRRRVAAEAAPVYAHLHNGNSDSVGIELAHSGRADDPFPAAQVRSLSWLLRSLLELSGGRLTAADVYGHKDLDRRPAYQRASCERPGCPYFVDGQGRALRRRVDPPESLFAALAREGLAVPRPPDGDADLRRAETIAPGERPPAADPASRARP